MTRKAPTSLDETLLRHGFAEKLPKPEKLTIEIPATAVAEAMAKPPESDEAADKEIIYLKGEHTIVVKQDDGSWVHLVGTKPTSKGSAANLEAYLCEHGLGDAKLCPKPEPAPEPKPKVEPKPEPARATTHTK